MHLLFRFSLKHLLAFVLIVAGGLLAWRCCSSLPKMIPVFIVPALACLTFRFLIWAEREPSRQLQTERGMIIFGFIAISIIVATGLVMSLFNYMDSPTSLLQLTVVQMRPLIYVAGLQLTVIVLTTLCAGVLIGRRRIPIATLVEHIAFSIAFVLSALTIAFVLYSQFTMVEGSLGVTEQHDSDFARELFALRVLAAVAMLFTPVLLVAGSIPWFRRKSKQLGFGFVAAPLHVIAWLMIFCHPGFLPTV